ncbi:MAG: Tfx family DNA-binding protein [Methanotrichaceae archaeon]|nr:Tfx family DNA-binding protein [Methanotrichaceae archaeon]
MNPCCEDELKLGPGARTTSKDDHEPENGKDSFLTDRQVKVLELRLKGCSQQDIADILGTCRSNISILEKRAHRNISRAKRTLHQWMMIQSPIFLKLSRGTDVFDISDTIFAAADEKGIHLPITSLDIIVQLKSKAPNIFGKRYIKKDVQIYISEVGDLMIQEL